MNRAWAGDYLFLLESLVLKDFRIRYRNMSLGMLWSLLNPLIMIGVFTFIFSIIFKTKIAHYPLFLLCGIVPWNFFSVAWLSGTTSLVDNAGLIRRVPVPREVIPVATVLSTCIHLLIQIALLVAMVAWYRLPVTVYWFWLPLIWGLEVVFVCGLALLSSVANLFLRDTRYIVESSILVLFWMVPIFYSFEMVPDRFRTLYQFNPVAALVMAMRNVLLEGHAPAMSLVSKLAAVSFAMLAIGWAVFQRSRRRMYNYL